MLPSALSLGCADERRVGVAAQHRVGQVAFVDARSQRMDHEGHQCRGVRALSGDERSHVRRRGVVSTLYGASHDRLRLHPESDPVSAMRAVKTFEFTCERKGCVFRADKPPKRCPRCKSPYWNVKRGTLPRGRPPGKRKGRKEKR